MLNRAIFILLALSIFATRLQANRVPTLNKMGFHDLCLNLLTNIAIHACEPRNTVALDIGCAMGAQTLGMILEGAFVYGLDLEPRHIKKLVSRLPKKYRKKFAHLPGRFPNLFYNDHEELAGSIDVILAAKVFQFLEGEEWPRAFQTVARLLKNGGKFFALMGMPENFPEFRLYYEQLSGKPYPGTLDVRRYAPQYADYLPRRIYVVNREEVSGYAKAAGLTVQFLDRIPVDSLPQDLNIFRSGMLAMFATKGVTGISVPAEYRPPAEPLPLK